MSQTPCLKYQDDGETIDYTPGSAVTAGDVVVLGNSPMIAPSDIAANAKGALKATGIWKVPKKTGAIAALAPIFWDPLGDPVTGTAGTGAGTDSAAAGGKFMGYAALAALTGDTYVYVILTAVYKPPFSAAQVVVAAGSAQGDAVAITVAAPINVVHVTGADATKGAKLPTAVAGMIILLKNDDAANAVLKVYPSTGGAINAIAANGAISMAAKTAAIFFAISTTQWFTIPLLPS